MSQIKLNISQSKGYEDYNIIKVKEYCNKFVWVKLLLKKRYKTRIKNADTILRAKTNIERLEEIKRSFSGLTNVINCKSVFNLKRDLNETYRILRNAEKLKEENEISISKLEGMMMDLVYYGDKVLSTHQKIQLLGGGMAQAQEIVEPLVEMGKLSSVNDVKFIDLVMHHTEYQRNKQRERDWIDCELWEMPVFQACMEEMIGRTHDYEKITGRDIMMEILEESATQKGKRLVPLQTEIGTVMTMKDDINAKYDRKGKVIHLKTGQTVKVYKK